MTLFMSSLLTFMSFFEQTRGVTLSSETEIYPSDFEAQDNFGYSVAISGDIGVAGVRQDDSNKGSISIITKNNGIWSEDVKLYSSDRANGDTFGTDVGIYDNMIIVGSPNRDSNGLANVGASYIYKKDDITGNWNENNILIGSTSSSSDKCGQSVSISKNSAIFGCGLNGDKAFIFEYDETSDTWTEVYNHYESPAFGFSVSIFENIHAIIGDAYEDSYGEDSGTAYIITRDTTSGTWSRTHQLFASDAHSIDRFGYDVTICKDYAMIGAFNADVTGASNNGVVYVFKRDTNNDWIEMQILTPSRINANGQFGNSVSMNCNENNYYAIIGMFEDDTNGNNVGSAFVFELDTINNEWIETNILDASESDPGDRFGTSVGAGGSDNCVIVGVPFHNHQATSYPNVGSTFIYCPETPTSAPTQPTIAPTQPTIAPTLPTSAPIEPTVECQEYSHKCTAWGDPHYETWDGTKYHFQGAGYFDFVKSCDEINGILLPFKISGKQEKCRNDFTCVKEVIVTIYSMDGINDILISFPSDSFPIFKDSGLPANGNYNYIDINGNIAIYKVRDNWFEIRFYYESKLAKMKFYYKLNSLTIQTTGDCIFGSNVNICGLCGNLNELDTDDFMRCDNLDIINNNNASNAWENANSWQNTNTFGESCCNSELDELYLEESERDCGYNPEPPICATECILQAKTICEEAYDYYCKECESDPPAANNWIDSCAFDICADSVCNDYVMELNGMVPVKSAKSMGCLDTSINECLLERYNYIAQLIEDI